MNNVLIFITSLMTIISQLILKKGVDSFSHKFELGIQHFVLAAIASPYVWAALFLQGLGYFLWFFVLINGKLSVSFAISGSFFYIILAVSSWYFLGEKISFTQGIGLVLVSVGVLILNLNEIQS